MSFIIGTKQKMTQVFDEDGRVHPATIVTAEPVVVTQVKTADIDGYTALQVGQGSQKEKRIAKPQIGHMKKAGGAFARLKEFRTEDVAEKKVGDTISLEDVFTPGDKIIVSANSKGKGFQGVVKRHGFSGGPRTHGQKHTERAPGSIGSTGPQRVFKGTKMAGRMGGTRVTVKGLKVLQIDGATNTLLISGAVPGHKGSIIEIRKA